MKKDVIPWGWVGATAYTSALVFAFSSQWLGVAATEDFLYRYQTLVAGSVAIVSVYLAVRQLGLSQSQFRIQQLQQLRDKADVIQELDLILTEFEETQRNHEMAAAILSSRSRFGLYHLDKRQWERLASQAPASVERSVHRFISVVDMMHEAVAAVDRRPGQITEMENAELNMLLRHVEESINQLRSSLQEEDASLMRFVRAVAN
jgi:hypothetical protein